MKKKKQILVVEDNEINQEIISSILENDFNVLKANDGLEALKIIKDKRNSISLIMTDVNMPNMNGYELLDEIKKDPQYSLIPTIVLTQSNNEDEEILALQHGANDFLTKPYRPQIILHRANNLINFSETRSIVHEIKNDILTGVYTKEYFYRKAKEILSTDVENQYSFVCTNVENFKIYNDIFGQEAGDKFIKRLSQSIVDTIPETALVGRLNSDRFIILLKSVEERVLRKVFADRRLTNKENATINIGVYEIIDRNVSVESMVDRARIACDAIKGQFDNHFYVYNEELRDKLLKERAINESMELSLKNREFRVFLQPKVSLKNNSIVGAEALVRWWHTEWGIVSPAEFVPLFEKNGFISVFDEYMFEEVFSLLYRMKKAKKKLVPISINVSRVDIFKLNLVDIFNRLVKKYRINPRFIHLELTESAYTESVDKIINVVNDLRELGFVIEMDDFGSGYSSLNMLSEINVDIIKLDMKFIHNELNNLSKANIIGFTIDLAHKMNMEVVAEGIENHEQALRLLEMGCDYAQGYYFYRPMEEKEYIKLIDSLPKNDDNFDFKEEKIKRNDKSGLIIIDDDPLYFNYLKNSLEKRFDVINLKNLDEVKSFISTNKQEISIILINSMLDNVDAKEILKEFKKDSKLWTVPTLALINRNTSCLDSFELEDVDDFLCKHHPLNDVIRRIDALIRINESRKTCILLKEEASHDYLTGLLNRRGLEWKLDLINKNDYPFAVYVFDLDNLKGINDNNGHELGDKVIKLFSDVLKKRAHRDDIVCRYGGDEFILISKRAVNKNKAIEKGEDICSTFQILATKENIPASVSGGMALCSVDEVLNLKILDKADKALYKAKGFKKGHCVLLND